MKVTESAPMQMQLLPPRPGLCALCAVNHEPNVPHNAQSLFYCMRFQIKHGRSPTWADAIAHCDLKVRVLWREALGDKNWTEPETGEPIAEPYVKQQ